jgi:hypothetical protein
VTRSGRGESLIVTCHEACEPRPLQRLAPALSLPPLGGVQPRMRRIALVGNTGCPTLAAARLPVASAPHLERLRAGAAQWSARLEETCGRIRAAHRAVTAALARAGARDDTTVVGLVYAAESGAMHLYDPDADRFVFLG